MNSIFEAQKFASICHVNQKRFCGEDFVYHPIRVMQRLQDLGVKKNILICALLHDVLEDTHASEAEVEKKFGSYVARVVESLSKEPREEYSHIICINKKSKERLKDYCKKIQKACKKYPEVLLIKMSDQIDNLKSINVFPEEKKKKQIHEIRDCFLPIYKENERNIGKSIKVTYLCLFNELKTLLELHI
ncbi:HD domain-containing protein [Candidatus Peregrinibacteria bacterium]|jgi:GTP diphosphokinase / guanosine-3',5'-bis(diphosphate) 3'-diphosphatase|nr:HD domain-containing protein [Candidatus Peregrinibacteria bacterium]